MALLAGPGLAPHVESAAEVIDRISAADDAGFEKSLAAIRGPAMLLDAGRLIVLAANPAAVSLGARRHQPLDAWPPMDEQRRDLAAAVRKLANGGAPGDITLSFGERERNDIVIAHLSWFGARHAVLLVVSGFFWQEQTETVLRNAFQLTAAEARLVGRLAGGLSIADIASRTGRSEGTLRAQVHAVLSKSGARSQTDLVRLALMLNQAVPTQPEAGPEPFLPARPDRQLVEHHVRMPDGRNLNVLSIGDQNGRPFIWTMSTLGLGRWHRQAEAMLAGAGLRMLVPLRAGFGHSSQPPPGEHIHALAATDMIAMMTHFGMARSLIVATGDDLPIALRLAKAAPARVSGIIGIGAGFPIRTREQYARLHPMTRFFRANARFAPLAMPYLAKLVRAQIRSRGTLAFTTRALQDRPVDKAILEDPGTAAAISDGFQPMIGAGIRCDKAFAAEVIAIHQDWPDGFGDVDCPVTLIHGEHDGNAPIATARDYAAMYPNWRLKVYPDAGQLVAYQHWRDLMRLIAEQA
jgi:pimeloyl-ACP methyl ester carboxylesterase/DNA-binding CsgD family transcriptional regulator